MAASPPRHRGHHDKLADEETGSVSAKGRFDKRLTATDRSRLEAAVGVATAILTRFGADPETMFTGTVNAGHPGGTLPLSEATARTFHDEPLPDNVYVADASLLPRSLGAPPILTIIAMAKHIASLCRTPAPTGITGGSDTLPDVSRVPDHPAPRKTHAR